MRLSADIRSELAQLVDDLHEQTLTEPQLARLNQLLFDDEACRREYIRLNVMYTAFRSEEVQSRRPSTSTSDLVLAEIRARRAGGPIPDEPIGSRSTSPVPPVIIQSLPSHLSPIPSFLFSYLTAAMIVGTGLLLAWLWKLPGHHAEVAGGSPPAVEKRQQESKPVARISGMVDCELEGTAGTTQKSILGLSDRIVLKSGLLELTYDTGAKVILQGPATYQVESVAGGYLSVGKLTARLDSQSEISNLKSQLPNQKSEIINHKSFAVRTPTAIVTDLGTEFGVEVDSRGDTTSRVFRGSIRVDVLAAEREHRPMSRVLHENESVRVEGNQGKTAAVLKEAGKPTEFIRQLPRRSIKKVDLVDVVAGGNGFGTARGRGIDPTTGQISSANPSVYFPVLAGDRKYHRVEGLPLVDGVFIPNGASGAVQVDSAGHTFGGFDKTDNLTYGHIWAGGSIGMPDSPKAMNTTLRGIDDYASPGHGLLLIHANGGITFDLDAIRRATGGGRITRFRTVGGNAATMADVKTVYADLWVLVDGKQRFVRGQDAGRIGPTFVDVGLKDKDRFLTVAFTDGGDGCGWDWTILGDPHLDVILSETPKAADAEKP